ncbi:MAG: thioredoxin [Clostridia bacterium]|nr:thioredoxin [Clostridia bacterium]
MEYTLTQDNFDSEVLAAEGLVLVDFFATWCGPCSMLAPHVTRLAEELPEVKVCRLDVDSAMEIAVRYGISSIPALFYFRGGEIVKTLVGYCDYEELRRATEELL